MRKLLKLLALVGISALPALAFGQTLNPQGEDAAWPLYVMGNGEAIYEILTAIKLLVLSPAFKSLLLFVATVGTVITGVAAGFNPGQNVIKFFSFFLSAWFVIFVSNQLKSDVAILDKVNNYNNVVTGVPAIVAVPASVISQTGHWMTTKIEQNFSVPSSLQLSGSKSSGTFALPAKMIADSGKMVITNAPLKANIANYVGDCLVPALARNNISLQELMSSTNFWKTAEFNHKGILTKYVPITESPSPMGSVNNWKGELKSCEEAYAAITTDLDTYGSELIAGSSAAWTNTGVMVPLENMFSDTMNWISGSTGANPAGLIKQRVILNSLSGAFRSAATQTGNNEMLTNIAVSTAEESQRSGWAASAAIFNNMMGYVFSTLQAFIFAIVPLIIVAALIPGFGKTIFVNYGQIMLWLALWEPMLAVVNFLIAVFAKNAMGGILGTGESMGFTFHNNFVMTQEANNLVIASQFLGTMVPMITWGLVKGAMAFTEFISHGIGANLGAQAGKEMATGNVGLNNAQFDNFSANKMNSTSQSSLGFGDVNSSLHAGHGGPVSNLGGSTVSQHGSMISASASVGRKSAESTSDSTTQSLVQSTKESTSVTNDKGVNNAGSIATAHSDSVSGSDVNSTNKARAGTDTDGKGSSTSKGFNQDSGVDANHSQNEKVAGQSSLALNGGGNGNGGKNGGKGGSLPGVSPGAGLNAGIDRGTGNEVKESAGQKRSAQDTTTDGRALTNTVGAGNTKTFGTTNQSGITGTMNSGASASQKVSNTLGADITGSKGITQNQGNSMESSKSQETRIPGMVNEDVNDSNITPNHPHSPIGGIVDQYVATTGAALDRQASDTNSLYNQQMAKARALANTGVTDNTGFKEKFSSLAGEQNALKSDHFGTKTEIEGGAKQLIDTINGNLDNFLPTSMYKPGHGFNQGSNSAPWEAGALIAGSTVMKAGETFAAMRAGQALLGAGETAAAASSGASALTGIGATGVTGMTGAGIFGTGVLATGGLAYLAFNDNHETNTGVANAISSGGQSFANFFGAQKTFGSRNMPETN